MSVQKGNTSISKIYYGNIHINKSYIGNNIFYPDPNTNIGASWINYTKNIPLDANIGASWINYTKNIPLST